MSISIRLKFQRSKCQFVLAESVSVLIALLVVSLPLVDHWPLVDTLCLGIGMVEVGWDMVESFGNTLVVLVVQGIIVVVGLKGL